MKKTVGFLAGLGNDLKKLKLKKQTLTKTHINGKKVVLETVIQLKMSSDATHLQKFREYVLEDGSTVKEPIGKVQRPQHVIDQEKGFYMLKPLEFNAESKRWLAAGKKEIDAKACVENFKRMFFQEMKLISYNVWFSKINQANRGLGLIDLCEQYDADILCFQEVTPTFLDMLKNSKFIQTQYYLSDITGSTLRGSGLKYGVVMLLKKPLDLSSFEWKIYTLPSRMNRRPLIAKVSYREPIAGADSAQEGKKEPSYKHHHLLIATSHLESLHEEVNVKFRKIQQEQIFKLLEESNNVDEGVDSNDTSANSLELFCGDFNYDPVVNASEKFDYPQGFSDTAVAFHLKAADSKEEQVDLYTRVGVGGKKRRIDRVLFRSKCEAGSHVCVAHEIIGKEPNLPLPEEELTNPDYLLHLNSLKAEAEKKEVTEKECETYLTELAKMPSDHFGLFTVFKYQ